MAIKCFLDLDVPWPSNVSDEASRVQDVARVELVLDPLHDPAGPARVIPDADGVLHRERRRVEHRVARAGARDTAPLAEHVRHRVDSARTLTRAERAGHHTDARVCAPRRAKPS